MKRRLLRHAWLVAAVAMLVGLIAAPASATKPDPATDLVAGHKIWICHATRSLSNPYVKILIDIAAWDIADPDSSDHGPQHHLREKDGVMWADYALESPEDECSLEPPPPLLCPDSNPADYIVVFDGSKLINYDWWQTVNIAIAAGTYDVTLISGDHDRGGVDGVLPYQPHEQWRLLGDTSSGFSDDLPDVGDPITGEVTDAGTVVFNSAVSQVTAEHWRYTHPQDSSNPNSVIPEYACLTATGGSET